MNENDQFEQLKAAIQEVVHDLENTEISTVIHGGWPRLRVERRLPDGSSRYMELKYVSPDPDEVHSYDRYATQFGVYGHRDSAMNFDSRQWGDLSHVVSLVREFIVHLVHENTLIPFVPPIPPDQG